MTRVTDHTYIASMTKLTSFEEVEEVLKSRKVSAGKFEEESLPFRGDSLIELDGAEHLARRRLEAPLFSGEALTRYEVEVLDPAVERCFADLEADRGEDGTIRTDVVRLLRRMLLQIAAAVIGLDDVETPERTALLESYMYPLNEGVDVKFSTGDHEEVIREGLAAKEGFLRDLFLPSQEHRRRIVDRIRSGEVPESVLPADLISRMLLHHDDAWDDDLIAREAILYLAGATLTTSSAVTHAVVELTDWFEEHPEDAARVADLTFLRGVCNETLRLHPNITAMVRRAREDVVLASGREFRAGEVLALNIVRANRDPKVFGDDADRFDPHRSVPGNVRPYGLSFGAGPHVCIGRPLVTTVSGGMAEREGETDRVMIKLLKALLDRGVRVDPLRPPVLADTAEAVYRELPVVFEAA
jgi:cytochrome P450